MGLQEIVEASVKDLRSIKDLIDGRIFMADTEAPSTTG